jgi:hypothetical protein
MIFEKNFEKNFARNYENKIILGTSDAWSMSHLSQQTSEPAYNILDCRILSKICDKSKPNMCALKSSTHALQKAQLLLSLSSCMARRIGCLPASAGFKTQF